MNHPAQPLRPIDEMPLDELCINTIRTLAMDAVERAQSGHPGTPMALAPAAYVLWTRLMRYSPRHPEWFDRDRFVLSNGHASMLLYAQGWLEWTGAGGAVIGVEHFGASAPGKENLERYGFTVENVVEKATQLLEGEP